MTTPRPLVPTSSHLVPDEPSRPRPLVPPYKTRTRTSPPRRISGNATSSRVSPLNPGPLIPPAKSICRHDACAHGTSSRPRLGLSLGPHRNHRKVARWAALEASARPDSGPLGISGGITAPSVPGFLGLDQGKQCPSGWNGKFHLPSILPVRRCHTSAGPSIQYRR
jgi:hypothetical protein